MFPCMLRLGCANLTPISLVELTSANHFSMSPKHAWYVNMICSGPLGSRAAKAIGFIEKMIDYSYANAPLQKELLAGHDTIQN